MSDWSKEVVEHARRLPLWVRLVLGAAGVGLIVYGAVGLAFQASTRGSSALIVGLILAAWIGIYFVVRLMRKRAG